MEQGYKSEIIGIDGSKEGFIGVDLVINFEKSVRVEFNAEEFQEHFNLSNFLIFFTGKYNVVLTKHQIREIWGSYLDILWNAKRA